jgi:class 3 adenylate cyclase
MKNQINAYFQKIVDIINKYDGEIIKFAGDALFIIWQTKITDTSKSYVLPAVSVVC